MSKAGAFPQDEIDQFLRTGDDDLLFVNWPGANIFERADCGTKVLAEALIDEVRRRAAGVTIRTPDALRETDIVTFTRAKIEPMVKGLFPRKEQAPVLDLLGRSLVFLTPDTIEPLIRDESDLSTSWLAVNVYLASIGAEPLAPVTTLPVGFQEDTKCYVSMEYFDVKDPLADYVVHEAAHALHTVKRKTIGLPATQYREWLLAIEFVKRETFAYSCEIYSRILELAKCPSDRMELLEKLKRRRPPSSEWPEFTEILDILEGALNRRNGWKTILERCSPKRKARGS